MTYMVRAPALVRVSLAAAILSIAACNDDGSLSKVRPEIETTPGPGSEILFDEVILTRSEVDPQIIDVRNVGGGSLVIEDVRIEGAGAAQFRVSSFPSALAPGQEGEVFVRFEPVLEGEHRAELIIVSNDASDREVRFTLVGPVREPCSISVGPSHQSFLLGEIRQVTIRAETSFECKIVRIFTDRGLFEIMNEPELPYVIQPGGELVLEVQHVDITSQPGIPTREMRIKESEGTEKVVTFEGEPPVYGCLEVPVTQLFFGSAPVGAAVQRSVPVRNNCSREAFVTSAVVSNGYYFFTALGDYPVVVPPLGSISVPVQYEPFSPLNDVGRLNINTNDAANPRFVVELVGQAQVPNIQAFPAALDFGTVVFKNPQGQQNRSECASRTRFVQIYSTGDADLIVDQLEIEAGNDNDFIVTSVTVDGVPVPNFNMPIAVPPGQEMRATLQFYPTREMPAEHESKLLIHHNAAPDPQEVVLLGQGTGDGATTDIFYQLDGPKLDILWVIDDSCSMFDEQARLISNLSQFVGYADSQNADYQMAVTNTDSRSTNAGKLERCFPHPSVIRHDYADTETREEAFECLFDVGTAGQGLFEAGLGAAMRALERGTDPSNNDPTMNPNAALLRPDAKLAIVVMSDEDDQAAETQEVMRDFFFSVKGSHRPDRVSVHAIAGPVVEPCQTGPRQSSPGFRYRWMTQQTSGIFFNICIEDWQPVLRDLGLNVFTPNDEWDLSQAADPSSLAVTVDGSPVPRDSTNGYTYNPAGNSIKFNGTALPDPGAEIVADYTGLCRP